MYEYKKYKNMYIISAICLICFASTFLLMPISNYVPIEYSRASAMIIGIVFWVTGIIGYLFLFVLYRNIKSKKKRRIYIFANRITIIADIVFLLGIICGILVLSLKIASTYFGYITIFILVLSLNIHFIFSRNILRKLEKKEEDVKNEDGLKKELVQQSNGNVNGYDVDSYSCTI